MTDGIPTLTTDRLILRPLERADADAVQALFPRWDRAVPGQQRPVALSGGWRADVHSRSRASRHARWHGVALVDQVAASTGPSDRRDHVDGQARKQPRLLARSRIPGRGVNVGAPGRRYAILV